MSDFKNKMQLSYSFTDILISQIDDILQTIIIMRTTLCMLGNTILNISYIKSISFITFYSFYFRYAFQYALQLNYFNWQYQTHLKVKHIIKIESDYTNAELMGNTAQSHKEMSTGTEIIAAECESEVACARDKSVR